MAGEAHAEAQRLLVQGYLVGALYARHDVTVEQGRDDAGVYLPFFDVTTALGARARVRVEQLPVRDSMRAEGRRVSRRDDDPPHPA